MLATMLAMVLLGKPDAATIRLKALSMARGRFDRAYRATGIERLDVLERLGTTGTGNPVREHWFPAGRADECLWLVGYGDGVGDVVHLRWKGRATKADWVLHLGPSPRQELKPQGTLARVLWILGFHPTGRVSPAQRAGLDRIRGYASYGTEHGLGPPPEIDCSYVFPDGILTVLEEYDPAPAVDTRGVNSWSGDRGNLGLLVDYPPITRQEATAMGFPNTKGWHGPGKFDILVHHADWSHRNWEMTAAYGRR